MRMFLSLIIGSIALTQLFASDELATEELRLESEIEAMIEERISDIAEFDNDLLIDDDYIPEEMVAPISIENPVAPVQVERVSSRQIALNTENVEITPTGIVDAPIETFLEETGQSIKGIEISLREVFKGSPFIYSLLLILSFSSLAVWFYSMMTIRSVEFLPPAVVKELRTKLVSNQFDEALDICTREKHFFCKMLSSGILARRYGLSVMVDTMKTEGKRSTTPFWQRIGILNDIAVIAPMIGLLGTVLGMFYAFYDLNRSIESVSLLFDGLGISVGTTVAGLGVAILAMILHSIVKFRLVRVLANVENEAQTFAALIDNRAPTHAEK